MDIDKGPPYIRPTCYPAVPGGESVIRLSLGKLLVNLLQAVKRTINNTLTEGLFPHLVVFRLPYGSNEWRLPFSWIGVSQGVGTLGLALFRIRPQIGTAGLARRSHQAHQLKASNPPFPGFSH